MLAEIQSETRTTVAWVLHCDVEKKDNALEYCVIFSIGTLKLKRVKKQLHSTCK